MAFLSHPALSQVLSEDDQKVFKYLEELNVEDFSLGRAFRRKSIGSSAPAAAAASARPKTHPGVHDCRPGVLTAAAVIAKELFPESDLEMTARKVVGNIAENDVIKLVD